MKELLKKYMKENASFWIYTSESEMTGWGINLTKTELEEEGAQSWKIKGFGEDYIVLDEMVESKDKYISTNIIRISSIIRILI